MFHLKQQESGVKVLTAFHYAYTLWQVPDLASRHLRSIREFHSFSHHSQHFATNAQVPRRPTVFH